MTGLENVLGRIGAIRTALPRAAQKGVHAALEKTYKGARNAVPVDTGRLRDSLHIRETPLSGVVSASCEYAFLIESRQPFLSPAAKQTDFTNECAKALKEALHD